jgi:hypothetical protein
MLYAFFWVIPRRLNFIRRRFGKLCSIFIGRLGIPNRRHIKFRRRGITQKKTHNIQNTAEVLNRVDVLLHCAPNFFSNI